MSFARGYTLDLYCDAINHDEVMRVVNPRYVPGVVQFIGETWAGTSRDAKRRGWQIDKERGAVVCPHCTKAGVKVANCSPR